MKQRDKEIKYEESAIESIEEEIVSRQLMIKEKRAFLETESENNIELEKKIEIRERQNAKLREQRQYVEGMLQNSYYIVCETLDLKHIYFSICNIE